MRTKEELEKEIENLKHELESVVSAEKTELYKDLLPFIVSNCYMEWCPHGSGLNARLYFKTDELRKAFFDKWSADYHCKITIAEGTVYFRDDEVSFDARVDESRDLSKHRMEKTRQLGISIRFDKARQTLQWNTDRANREMQNLEKAEKAYYESNTE